MIGGKRILAGTVCEKGHFSSEAKRILAKMVLEYHGELYGEKTVVIQNKTVRRLLQDLEIFVEECPTVTLTWTDLVCLASEDANKSTEGAS